ncbi:hypothetical protein V8B97DRAFT_2026396 [Scleroderma yunnanense]
MRLINVEGFIERERKMSLGWPVNRQTRVLGKFYDDEIPEYAILSHQWMKPEVNYDEMVKLAKMDREERDKIRHCEQAKKDGHKWLWVDTCCIKKHSSAELSEAINSMYWWYENSRVCYAYLHNVPGPSFPKANDKRAYPDFNGHPEWFSHGWTLQEMIAPRNVQFFNKDWEPIGDKRTLAETLTDITRDRAYSLLGLLDVNMPMLYGEGKNAFHRLQLEIICMSNDQSIFAWGLRTATRRTGSILADDPSFFCSCYEMKLMDHNEYIQCIKKYIPDEELRLIDEDPFGVFPITNHGIQIWMFLCPLDGSDTLVEAWLPCRINDRFNQPVRITLALWNSNYYRYCTSRWKGSPTEGPLWFRQVYLRYQDTPHRDATFKIDDSGITKNGFTYCGTYPSELSGNTLKLTSMDPLCVRVYSDSQHGCLFAVGFGQCFGQDWMHFVYEKSTSNYSWENYSRFEYPKMLVRSQDGCHGHVWVKHTCLPESTWTVRTSCVMWESSRRCGVKIDALQYSYNGPDKWISFDVEGTNDPNCDMHGLMIPRSHGPNRYGVSMEFLQAPHGIKLGDYGNIFFDFRALALELDTNPRQHKIDQKDGDNADNDHVEVHCRPQGFSVTLYKPLGLSLPSNHDFNSLMASFSTQLTNRYLIIRVIQCGTITSGELSSKSSRPVSLYSSPALGTTMPLCIFAKPFVWHQDEGACFASVGVVNQETS